MFVMRFCMFLALIPVTSIARKSSNRDLLVEVDDIKDFKKLLRTKTNVLVIFCKTEKSISKRLDLYGNVADKMRGEATLVTVDCSDAKKLCKKMKAKPSPIHLKHYKNGEFNKDYDRQDTLKSMLIFLKDPTGDTPWEEDGTASNVVHLDSPEALKKMLQKDRKPTLVMFYAPWCGFCKRLKPDWAEAATELKGQYTIAGMDVDRSIMMPVRLEYNITGFPTIFYFEKGIMQYKYGGESNKDGIISWLKDPHPPREPVKEEQWSDTESDVVHLTDDNFDDYLKENPSVLVMFYAPWCGHCKKMKPDYQEAATKMKEENVNGILAAVDATKETVTGKRFKIEGYPTVKYFRDGEFAFDIIERTGDKMIEFMKDPKEPPPPPPADAEWSESTDAVLFLTDDTFKNSIKKKKHALVMFYAPWCGHCKVAKPKFTAAAEKLLDDPKVAYAAVDCTKETAICGANDVTGYPTLMYFKYGKNPQMYSGGREEDDFVNFMKDPLNPMANSAPPPEPTPEEEWAEVDAGNHIKQLKESNFEYIIKSNPSVLVMFYAPWCGHCKNMKPDYAMAAEQLNTENVNGVLAAVDATVERSLSEKYGIKGFPTIKHFENGALSSDYNLGRTADEIVAFMRDPKIKPSTPEPPVEPKWSDEPSAVYHLAEDNFNSFINSKDGVLVMFYAPWCGHCKNAKPSFIAAAELIKEDKNSGKFAAVDCTTSKDLCSTYQVTGFPTIKYFKAGKFVADFTGSRSQEEFVNFVKNQPEAKDEL